MISDDSSISQPIDAKHCLSHDTSGFIKQEPVELDPTYSQSSQDNANQSHNENKANKLPQMPVLNLTANRNVNHSSGYLHEVNPVPQPVPVINPVDRQVMSFNRSSPSTTARRYNDRSNTYSSRSIKSNHQPKWTNSINYKRAAKLMSNNFLKILPRPVLNGMNSGGGSGTGAQCHNFKLKGKITETLEKNVPLCPKSLTQTQTTLSANIGHGDINQALPLMNTHYGKGDYTHTLIHVNIPSYNGGSTSGFIVVPPTNLNQNNIQLNACYQTTGASSVGPNGVHNYQAPHPILDSVLVNPIAAPTSFCQYSSVPLINQPILGLPCNNLQQVGCLSQTTSPGISPLTASSNDSQSSQPLLQLSSSSSINVSSNTVCQANVNPATSIHSLNANNIQNMDMPLTKEPYNKRKLIFTREKNTRPVELDKILPAPIKTKVSLPLNLYSTKDHVVLSNGCTYTTPSSSSKKTLTTSTLTAPIILPSGEWSKRPTPSYSLCRRYFDYIADNPNADVSEKPHNLLSTPSTSSEPQMAKHVVPFTTKSGTNSKNKDSPTYLQNDQHSNFISAINKVFTPSLAMREGEDHLPFPCPSESTSVIASDIMTENITINCNVTKITKNKKRRRPPSDSVIDISSLLCRSKKTSKKIGIRPRKQIKTTKVKTRKMAKSFSLQIAMDAREEHILTPALQLQSAAVAFSDSTGTHNPINLQNHNKPIHQELPLPITTEHAIQNNQSISKDPPLSSFRSILPKQVGLADGKNNSGQLDDGKNTSAILYGPLTKKEINGFFGKQEIKRKTISERRCLKSNSNSSKKNVCIIDSNVSLKPASTSKLDVKTHGTGTSSTSLAALKTIHENERAHPLDNGNGTNQMEDQLRTGDVTLIFDGDTSILIDALRECTVRLDLDKIDSKIKKNDIDNIDLSISHTDSFDTVDNDTTTDSRNEADAINTEDGTREFKIGDDDEETFVNITRCSIDFNDTHERNKCRKIKRKQLDRAKSGKHNNAHLMKGWKYDFRKKKYFEFDFGENIEEIWELKLTDNLQMLSRRPVNRKHVNDCRSTPSPASSTHSNASSTARTTALELEVKQPRDQASYEELIEDVSPILAGNSLLNTLDSKKTVSLNTPPSISLLSHSRMLTSVDKELGGAEVKVKVPVTHMNPPTVKIEEIDWYPDTDTDNTTPLSSHDAFHFSSEEESDVFDDQDYPNLIKLNEEELKKHIVKRRNEKTMYICQNVDKFSTHMKGHYRCELCKVYLTNGLFRLSKHLRKHQL